ncbi:valine--tRNA ligase [Candidatus Woesearchaeota archaeon]|jgi:valyl-tRNA synthetase|nr:valine--tRNA ligase [Candidatus Woesearchaeota archaeon]MBT4368878.1 valine--tRNA ligase [Candidatus Woesearchaeota archaeon]MBT4712167.1 valine--tRNA ligase [Candidatus Woesearchaeota archaeon]MBT6639085.1 valine--tRNA ligase [Candidatus Woesearchaeota archaeon]MBT7134285.1 valine--tRNA ligase [Candidatus Woesearchaeota archaeon]
MELPKHYTPKESEPKWQEFWEKENLFAFNADDIKLPLFTIDTPPPTVSGKMHMGHAFSNSHQDFIARFKRMQGFNVLQPLGTDDNGLPTLLLIQKLKKVNASKMDRKDFRKLVLETLEKELKPSYINDWRKLGISCDFNVTYSTIDSHCQKISQKSFIDLYKINREYRIEAPMMICPKCKTAISQVELEDAEFDSQLVYIKVKVETGDELVFATTRPELLPACVGISVHPDDERYKHLIGKKVTLPLTGNQVILSADKETDPEYGSGVVYYCSYGGIECVEWLSRHKDAEPIHIMGVDGVYNEKAGKYQGMNSNDARKEIIKDLESDGSLVKSENLKHSVNVHERCGTEIEYVATKQWFIKYMDMKDDMLKWGNELNWYPEHMKNRYDNWAHGLKWDWCISRQIPYGIPFPVWYCEDCDEVILAKEEDLPVDPTEDVPPVSACPKCKSKNLVGEKDIINTWATSSLTPTIVKELFKGKPIYDKLISEPESLRPQAHDIITFWLFNTVVKSQLHFKVLPWKDCMISGWMLDPKGKKMSKSKGNVIEPRDMIEKYSADALRFMAGGSKLGDDLPFPEKEVMMGQKTVTKLWNASKFAIMHLEDYKKGKADLRLVDRWVLTKLHRLIKSTTENFENYAFSAVRKDVDNFFWHVLSDNYLEIAKDRLYNPDVWGKDQRIAAQHTLYQLVLNILKLFAPFLPHITEEIYQLYFKDKKDSKSIHISEWPKYDEGLVDDKAEQIGDALIEVVTIVRKAKSDKQLSMKAPVKKLVITSELSFEEVKQDLEKTLFVENIEFKKGKLDVKIEFD